MKDLETISELRILYYAHNAVLERYLKESDRIADNPDMELPITKHWKSIYESQMNELHERIIELEAAKEQ